MSAFPYDPEAAFEPGNTFPAQDAESLIVDRGYSNSGRRNPQVYNDNSDEEEIAVDAPVPEVD